MTTDRATRIIDAVDTWHIAPEDQGQMIEIAYGASEDTHVVRRTTDTDGAVTYEAASAEDLVGDFAPWDGAPAIDGAWTTLATLRPLLGAGWVLQVAMGPGR